MAANVTTTAGVAAILRNYFEQKFLERLERELIAADLCVQKVIPANSGVTVDFHRIQALPKQTTAITQTFGSAHSSVSGLLKGDTWITDSVSATMELIGNDLQISELAQITAEPNPMPELSDDFLYNGSDTIDQKIINLMVCSSANGASNTLTVPSINYNGSSVSVTVVWGDGSATLTEATLDADIPTHRIAAESFNTAAYHLRNNRCPKHPKLGNRWAAIISPGQAADLRLDGTFQEIALKGQKMGEEKFESASLGDVFGFTVMESQNVAVNFPGTIDATNDEIYRAPCFGRGYAAKISHAKGVGKPRVTWLPPTPTQADPYGNNGYLVWKAYFAGTVINPRCGVILKSASTNGSPSGAGDDANWE